MRCLFGRFLNFGFSELFQHERVINFFSNYMVNPTLPLPGVDPLRNTPGKHALGEGMGMTSINLEHMPRTSENPIPPHWSSATEEMDKSIIIETAIRAMDELVQLFRMNEPLWIKASDDGRYTLNRDSYDKLFGRSNQCKTASARIESSKDSGEVAMAAINLTEMLVDVV